MARTIQHKRGLEKNLPTLKPGELAFTTDTKKVYIGSDTGNVDITSNVDTSKLATKTELSTVTAQLADIEDKQLEEYTFNLNALRKVRSKQFWSAINIGDSIAAGTGAPNNRGFIWQLQKAAQVIENTINYGNEYFYYNNDVGTWTKEETGIGKFLLSSKSGSKSLKLFQNVWNIPSSEYKVKVIYSKRPDGGNFNIGYDSTVLGTINSNGAAQDGIISEEFTVPWGKNLTIIPIEGQKAYINNVIIVRDSTKPYYAIDNFSVGGRKAKDYTNEQLNLMLEYLPRDLLIWELFANDYSERDFDSYKKRTDSVVSKAKSLGMDVLIAITCGNSTSESDPDFRNKWVAYLYEVAKRHDCAIIDYDRFFGGYQNANENGLMADTIHPSEQGHLLMANVLIDTLLGIKNPYAQNIEPAADDSRHTTYGYKKDKSSNYYPNTQVFDEIQLKTQDNNGNPQYKMVQPLLNVGGSPTQFPKYAPRGSIGSYGTVLYINTVDWGADRKTTAVWKALYQTVQTELVTSLPTANGGSRGRIVLLDGNGQSDDTTHICVKRADGTFVWKQITLS